MSRPRRPPSGELKAKVVLEARRGARPMRELAAEQGVHPLQITPQQRVALAEWPEVVSNRRGPTSTDKEALKAALDQQIGPGTVAVDWLNTQVGPRR